MTRVVHPHRGALLQLPVDVGSSGSGFIWGAAYVGAASSFERGPPDGSVRYILKGDDGERWPVKMFDLLEGVDDFTRIFLGAQDNAYANKAAKNGSLPVSTTLMCLQLPLKRSSKYKTEVDIEYLPASRLARPSAKQQDPADLDAFVKSFYAGDFSSAADVRQHVSSTLDKQIDRCITIAAAATDRYLKQIAQDGICEKLKQERLACADTCARAHRPGVKIWSGAIETRFQKAGDAGTSKDGTDPTSAAADASKPAAAPAVAPASSALRPAAAPVAPREAPPAAAPSAVRGANVQQQPPKLSAKGAISRPPQNGRSSALFTAAITATAKGGGGGGGDGRGSGSGSGSHGAPPAAKPSGAQPSGASQVSQGAARAAAPTASRHATTAASAPADAPAPAPASASAAVGTPEANRVRAVDEGSRTEPESVFDLRGPQRRRDRGEHGARGAAYGDVLPDGQSRRSPRLTEKDAEHGAASGPCLPAKLVSGAGFAVAWADTLPVPMRRAFC